MAGGEPHEAHLQDPERGGVEDFPEMEAERGGHVQVRVHVVHVVEAPQQGAQVVETVPSNKR